MRLHHVGILVRNIPKAAAEFTDRFGYEVESEVIEDPVQAAFVQFLRLPGSASWVELVTPNGSESRLNAGLRKGVSLHHTCYEVDDLDEACEHLRSHGMLMLAEPVPAEAFPGRSICWFMDRAGVLVELVGSGSGPFSLSVLDTTGRGL